MGQRRSQLVESLQGQHIALSVAAHLARSQLVPNRDVRYDTEHLFEMLDVLARALAKSAPLYVRDEPHSDPRELRVDEIEGLAVLEGGRFVVLKDGRKLSTVTIKRADLRDAIALLSCAGVPGLVHARPFTKPTAVERTELDPTVTLKELERLLRAPLVSPELEKAYQLLIRLARDSKVPGLGNTAMRLMTALDDCRGQDAPSETAKRLLADLRAALLRWESQPEHGPGLSAPSVKSGTDAP